MRWNAWGPYFLLAAIATATTAYLAPARLPGEQLLTNVFSLRWIPGIGGVLGAFSGIAAKKWLFGSLVLGVLAVMYFAFPPRQSVLPVSALGGGIALFWILGKVVVRPEPVFGNSFPSEPAMLYTTWLGGIAIVAVRGARSALGRRMVVGLLVLLILLGSAAGMYAGMTWFADVLVAWLWSLAWLCWLHQTTKSTGA